MSKQEEFRASKNRTNYSIMIQIWFDFNNCFFN